MIARIISRPSEDQLARVSEVKRLAGQPRLRGDEDLWILGEPLVIQLTPYTTATTHWTVPVGFTTDGASVPRWAQWLTGWGPWEEPQRWAGVLHDYLYTQHGVRKRYADRAFLAVLRELGSGRLRRWVMYLAVRIGGGPAYRQDQQRGPSIRR